ncbi:hypothetical protein [Streptomyces sp. NPDC052015]
MAGNVIAGLVLLAGTTGWQRIHTRQQAGRTPPDAIEPDEPPN